MIVEKVYEYKRSQIKQYPVNANRASSLGHPCTRYLVFDRTRWEEKTLHNERLQMIFDLGNDIEQRVLKDLTEAGLSIIEQQRSFSWPEYQITGHIDAKCLIDAKAYPLEIKSTSPFVFDKINSIDDMLKSKYAYMKAYPGQMMLYLLMDNKERGFFLLKNKVTGAMKEIPVDLDYDIGEALLQKATAINTHVANKTLPDPIEYDENVCSDCGYNHICTPDRIGKEVEIIDNEELEELLKRYEELKPSTKEYDEIDKRISEIVNGKEKLLVGGWFITGKEQTRKAFTVKEGKFWVKKIQRAT
jgi:CRISPR/Cas system-associated exonuclease Cas4 (RecB family)